MSAGSPRGSIVAQELALRHPQLVRSLVLQSTWPVMDPDLRSWLLFVRWLVELAPSERAFLEGFFLDIYTALAHNDGTVAQFIEAVLAFPHKHYLDAFLDHDTTDRLPQSWSRRPISPSRRSRRSGTPAWTPSGGRLRCSEATTEPITAPPPSSATCDTWVGTALCLRFMVSGSWPAATPDR
jgi:pimeloyl-ACP methyl ester carboxylesterase